MRDKLRKKIQPEDTARYIPCLNRTQETQDSFGTLSHVSPQRIKERRQIFDDARLLHDDRWREKVANEPNTGFRAS